MGVQITLVETPDDQRKHLRPGKTSKQKEAFQMNAIARVSIARGLHLITQKQISCRQQKRKMRNKGVILTHEEIIFIKPSCIYCVVIKTKLTLNDIWGNEAVTADKTSYWMKVNTFLTATNSASKLPSFPLNPSDILQQILKSL